MSLPMRALVAGLTQASLTGVDAWETSIFLGLKGNTVTEEDVARRSSFINATRDRLEANMRSESHKASARENSGLDAGLIDR
jgi:hypothetical protein